MIRVSQLKLPVTHTKEQLLHKIGKMLRLKPESVTDYKIRRQSIDARRKQDISYVYTVDVEVREEERVLRRIKGNHISRAKDVMYRFPEPGERILHHRPVIIGSGPAGLFCAYLLAEHGFCPLIVERGKPIEERTEDVEKFWKENILNPDSTVQF